MMSPGLSLFVLGRGILMAESLPYKLVLLDREKWESNKQGKSNERRY